jgi:hypothetical protein
MRCFAAGIAALALAACSGQAATDSGSAEAKDAAASGQNTAAQNSQGSDDPFSPGTYEIAVNDAPEGKPRENLSLTLKDDKSFEVKADGETQAEGTFEVTDTPQGSKACFMDKEDGGEPSTCITAGERKDDGSWTVTNDRNEPATMTRVGK